jgi:hypothetical protein
MAAEETSPVQEPEVEPEPEVTPPAPDPVSPRHRPEYPDEPAHADDSGKWVSQDTRRVETPEALTAPLPGTEPPPTPPEEEKEEDVDEDADEQEDDRPKDPTPPWSPIPADPGR